MSQPAISVDQSRELQHSLALSQRVLLASDHLFGSAPIGGQIARITTLFETRCRDIMSGRTGELITIAIVGSKGQGKTWVARQFVHDPIIQKQLPSGVLSSEATNQLYWIGPNSPSDLNADKEIFIQCGAASLIDLGFPFICLDTPGTTDANHSAAKVANDSMGIAPVQLLVIRRDQLRSATASQIVSQSEGIYCVPVITSIPLGDLIRDDMASESLQSDIRHWYATLQSTAPNTYFQDPILLRDFEASGDEASTGDFFRKEITKRLHGSDVKEMGYSTSTRIVSVTSRFQYDVLRTIESNAPQLATAVIQMQEAAITLPRKAIESVLGTEDVLEMAVRGRLRTQIVTDTSAIWFPYRPTLALLVLSQGAWDRLVMAMTGSLPSIFGTFFAWAKNVQQSRKFQWDIQEGLRERLNSQASDLLQPIQRRFHIALAELRGSRSWEPISLLNPGSLQGDTQINTVRLAGIDELQSQSQALFNELTFQARPLRWILVLSGAVGVALFWVLLSGPIISVYRQYLSASISTFSDIGNHSVEEFPHPSPSLLLTSVVLSFLPMLIYSMIILTALLRRSKILKASREIYAAQRLLVEQLQDDGILRLEFQDPSLQHAYFLLGLDRSSNR